MLTFKTQKNKENIWNRSDSNIKNEDVIIFLFSNQVLTAINLHSNGQIQSQDLIRLTISSQVSSKNKIIDTTQFGDTIADIAEVFRNRNKSVQKQSEIPCIFFIESDNFHITEYNQDKMNLGDEINGIKTHVVDYLSPYVPSDSYCEILDLSPKINNQNKKKKNNLVFTSKSYLTSWTDSIRYSKLSAAYIGPIINPIICKHAKDNDLRHIYVVLEKLSSRIYHIEDFTAYQYSLPIGTAQLCNNSDQEENLKSLSNQIANVLKTHDCGSLMERKNIIPIGWPATKSQSYRLFKRNFGKVKVQSLEDTSQNLYTNIAINHEEYLLVKDLCFAAKSCMEILK